MLLVNALSVVHENDICVERLAQGYGGLFSFVQQRQKWVVVIRRHGQNFQPQWQCPRPRALKETNSRYRPEMMEALLNESRKSGSGSV
jgi:hypothetical protein